MKKYVLLDRDGTLIVNKHYQRNAADTEILPGAIEGLRALKAAGRGLVVLTNQSGIGRGYFTRADVDAIHARMTELLGLGRALFDGIYVCPHTDAENCRCRKPLPGLAEQAAAELGFSLADAVAVGDREVDIEMARAAGAAAVLVRTSYGAKVLAQGLSSPDFAADNLAAAAEWILAR